MFQILASDPDTIASDSRSCEKDLEAKDRPASKRSIDFGWMSKMGASYLAKTVAKSRALPGYPRMHCRIRFFLNMLEHVGTTVFSTWDKCQI